MNSKFEDDKKAREEKGLPAKNLPADLQNKAKGQKRPRTFSGGNYRGKFYSAALSPTPKTDVF